MKLYWDVGSVEETEKREEAMTNVVHNYAYLVEFEKDKIWAGDLLLDFGENNDFVVFIRETQEDTVEEIKCALSFKDGTPQIVWEDVTYTEGVLEKQLLPENVRKGVFWSKNLDLCAKVRKFFRKGKELFQLIVRAANADKGDEEPDKAICDVVSQVKLESQICVKKAFIKGFYTCVQGYMDEMKADPSKRNYRVSLYLLQIFQSKTKREDTPITNDSNQEDAVAGDENVGNETASDESADEDVISDVPAGESPTKEAPIPEGSCKGSSEAPENPEGHMTYKQASKAAKNLLDALSKDEAPKAWACKEPQSRTSTLSILISKFLKFWKKLLNRLFK